MTIKFITMTPNAFQTVLCSANWFSGGREPEYRFAQLLSLQFSLSHLSVWPELVEGFTPNFAPHYHYKKSSIL
jgi:hypothetical protein